MMVTLSQSEMVQAGNTGVLRRVVSLGKLVDKMHSPDANPWQIDIEGAMAEMAYAKATGRFWSPGVNTFKAPDVGAIQIRSTPRPDGCLILRPNDSDSDVFVLVAGSAPTYDVVGWLRGQDGKTPVHLKAPNGRPPAWFVPQSRLSRMEDLK